MDLLLRKTKELEMQIDEYLDMAVKGALIFRQGIKHYLNNQVEEFTEDRHRIDEMESKGDALRRSIETRLYLETLIPEFRGDVLGLLESTDKVLNMTADTLAQFEVEKPKILDELKPLFLELADAATSAIESMALAIRSYFKELNKVRDNINKVMFYEKETDKISDRIKRTVFQTDLDLSLKIHTRYFAYHIELIADEAEDVCDRLSIAAIKRHL